MFSSKTTLRDMELIRRAFSELINDPSRLPVSYKLDGIGYHGFPEALKVKTERRLIDANIVERTYSANIPDTALTLRVECFEYKDFPVYEWTAYFENNSDRKSAVISDFFGINTFVPTEGTVTLYSNNGDFCNRSGLETTASLLREGTLFEAASKEGRSCDRAWPYYRITCEGGFGYNIAIGWPGNWKCLIEGERGGFRFKAKQEYTKFYLKPGETARSPRIVVMAFDGDSDRGINVWRRWMFAHNLPRTRGGMITPKMCFTHSGGGEEFTLATEENQCSAINRLIEKGVTPDIWWIDAGWYPCYDESGVKRWVRTGKWYPDPEKFPNGLGPVGKLCDRNGIQFLLWFEPERISLKYWPDENPKEYVLKLKEPMNNDFLDSQGLLDLGNPECREWLTALVKKVMSEGGVKVYRQDFNGNPFPLNWWLQNDGEENRTGITENKHIQGYLRYWDDLLFDIPDLWIDSCASGGRRNDIEAMRRAVTLHPTDYGYGEHPVKQAFQKTWYEWTPYFRSIASSWDDEDGNYGTSKPHAHGYDSYAGHCAFGPATTFGANAFAEEEEFRRAKAFRELYKRAAPYTLESNFFCLTPVRKSNEDYFSIQFFREETGDGLIQFIRNTRCEEDSITVMPKGFENEKNYIFEVPEEERSFTLSGSEINEKGLTASIEKRSGVFWFYRTEA